MEMDVAVNKVTRDLKNFGLISPENTEDVKVHLRLLWQAGFEYFRRTELTHNKVKIEYLDKQGNRIAIYNSIAEASRQLHIGRGTIDDILYGKTKGQRRTGNYFRYLEKCENS